ncbi:hypothetical protein, partial [Rhodoblastus sp.]|uniref:hypothetical protein n=1 Tax=Rhodoblastus sp. TaxID=1962975 RepID=UPI003F98D522
RRLRPACMRMSPTRSWRSHRRSPCSPGRQEATIMAYADGFYLVGFGLVLSLGAITLLRKPGRFGAPAGAH